MSAFASLTLRKINYWDNKSLFALTFRINSKHNGNHYVHKLLKVAL